MRHHSLRNCDQRALDEQHLADATRAIALALTYAETDANGTQLEILRRAIEAFVAREYRVAYLLAFNTMAPDAAQATESDELPRLSLAKLRSRFELMILPPRSSSLCAHP
jgi:hypothetical protein